MRVLRLIGLEVRNRLGLTGSLMTMNRGNIVPQAYTREQLTQAFTWVQSQPDSVRAMADTPDALVALYLRAKRAGEVNVVNELAAPVSEKNFRENLKTLAAEMQQFGGQAGPSVISTGPIFPTAPDFVKTQRSLTEEAAVPAGNSGTSMTLGTQSPSPTPTKPAYQMPNATSEAPTNVTVPLIAAQISAPSTDQNAALVASLDSRSREMLRKVQHRFNLSSEVEALRMLLVLGFEKAQSIFSKEF